MPKEWRSSKSLLSTADPKIAARMSNTRGKHNKREREIRSALFERGLRFRVHYRPNVVARRTIDIAIPGIKLAIFLDGCFWHGCPIHRTYPKTNAEFWLDKIEANIRRDVDTNRLLREAGWKVLRFWSHEKPEKCLSKIVREALKLERRRQSAKRFRRKISPRQK